MRSFIKIFSWAAIAVSAVSILGLLGNQVPALAMFQDMSAPWMGAVSPLVSNIGHSLFALDRGGDTALWITACLPLVVGLALLALPKPARQTL